MKGTFFISPLEYRISLNGEKWLQGDSISGEIKIIAHGADSIEKNDNHLFLAFIDQKKLKKNPKDGISIIQKIPLEIPNSFSLESEASFNIQFNLSSNCPITEKNDGPYVLLGNKENISQAKQLQLQVAPISPISQFLEIFENFYRFKVKSLKNKKDSIDIKMDAPGSKEYGAIETLNLLSKVMEEELHLDFHFKVKKLSYDTQGVSAKTVKIYISKILKPKQYKGFAESPNLDGIKACLDEVLGEVSRKTLL